MQANILTLISSRFDQMTATDQKIAKVVLNDGQAVINYTISQLAKAASVSDASVTRFCHNLKLSGFHQLKVELARANEKSAGIERLPQGDVEEALAQISKSKQAEIRESLENISGDLLDQVLDLLEKSQIIQVAAEGNTYPVAEDAVYKLNQLGLLAISAPSLETAIGQSLNLGKDSCLLLISNSGEAESLLKIARVAKKKGIKIISITNREDSPLAQMSDYHLQTAVRQTILQREYYYSRLASMSVVEAIFLTLLARKKEERLAHIQEHEALIADRKI